MTVAGFDSVNVTPTERIRHRTREPRLFVRTPGLFPSLTLLSWDAKGLIDSVSKIESKVLYTFLFNTVFCVWDILKFQYND